jgi:polyhydroxyalkanoate synthesis repressor PhaR
MARFSPGFLSARITMPLIKRYANRKLYDTEAKRYITLDGIAELIRRQQDVKVIDHESGEDLTALTQAQIIFEQERKIKGGIPHAVFTSLIQAGNDTLSQLRHAFIPPADWQREVDAEIERRVEESIEAGKITDDDGFHILDVLLSPSDEKAKTDMAPRLNLSDLLKGSTLPSRADIAALIQQIEALSQELDNLTATRRRRSPRRSVD